MADVGWHVLEDADPDDPAFPLRARFDGEAVLVFRLADGYRATQRTCPHRHASLAEAGLIGGGKMLRCALHGYTYKLVDGKGVNCPGFRIRVYDVVRENDRLLIRPAES